MPLVRRRHVRVPVDVPVWFHAGPSERVRGIARDVSSTGMQLEGALQPGTSRVYLEFALPHHRDFPVMAIGRVVWQREAAVAGGLASFGVEVLRFFPSARFAVRSFLERQRRRRLNYNLFDEAT